MIVIFQVTRSEEHLLEQAIRVMKFHADRKAVLEIEYVGEEGTGLGPTLEFYALVFFFKFFACGIDDGVCFHKIMSKYCLFVSRNGDNLSICSALEV